jgi:hypothetical protein
MMNADERMMRHVASSYRFRKYTNVGDYTEKELDRFVAVYRFIEEITDPVRSELIRQAILSSPSSHLISE